MCDNNDIYVERLEKEILSCKQDIESYKDYICILDDENEEMTKKRIRCPHKRCGGSLLSTTKIDDIGVVYVCDNCGKHFYGKWDEVKE
jgi:predicted RNA-binding Zn-ribbon protein involved in translation (DUF1610 family)